MLVCYAGARLAMCRKCWLLVVLAVSYTVTANLASPTHNVEMTTTAGEGNWTVTCSSNVSSDACQFVYSKNTSIDNFTLLEDNHTAKNTLYNYNQKTGVCSLILHSVNLDDGIYLVVCRMHLLLTGWQYAYDSIQAKNGGVLKDLIEITVWHKHYTVHKVDDDVGILCKLENSTHVQTCSFTCPNNTEVTVVDRYNSKARYFGNEPEKGHCGISFIDDYEKSSGIYWCVAGWTAMTQGEGRKPIVFIVATFSDALNHTALILTDPNKPLSTGDLLNATCSVGPSTPAATIKWMVGGTVLPPGQDVMDRAWKWPWEAQTTTQTISVAVKPEYENQSLVCVVEHPGLVTSVTQEAAWQYSGSTSGARAVPTHSESERQIVIHCNSAVYWLNVTLVVGILVAIFTLLGFFLVKKCNKRKLKRSAHQFTEMSDHEGCDVTEPSNAGPCNYQPDVNEYAEVLHTYQQRRTTSTVDHVCYAEPSDNQQRVRGFQEPGEYAEPLQGKVTSEPVTSAEYAEPLYLPDGVVGAKQTTVEKRTKDVDQGPAPAVVYAEVKKTPNPQKKRATLL